MPLKYYSFNNAISEYLDNNGYSGDRKQRLYDNIFSNIRMIGDSENYNIIGYGSLLNERSRNRTSMTKSVKKCVVPGYRRIFNVDYHSIYTVLNVEEYDSNLSAVSSEITYPEMIDFIIREMHYKLVKVKAHDWDDNSEFDAYMVVANEDSIGHSMPSVEYLHATIYGSYMLGEDFLNSYLGNTYYYSGDKVRNIRQYITIDQLEHFKAVDSRY